MKFGFDKKKLLVSIIVALVIPTIFFFPGFVRCSVLSIPHVVNGSIISGGVSTDVSCTIVLFVMTFVIVFLLTYFVYSFIQKK